MLLKSPQVCLVATIIGEFRGPKDFCATILIEPMFYSLMHKKTDKTIFKNCISEKFRKQLYFFTCISPEYVFHESPKEVRKNNHFENMRASFLRRCQNSPWQTSHEMMHFQA